MSLGQGGPHEEGDKIGALIWKDVILPILARLAWKWLQIGTDMLLIITSTDDELLRNVNINDLEWPWMTLNPQNKRFSEFFAILGYDMDFKSELHQNGQR